MLRFASKLSGGSPALAAACRRWMSSGGAGCLVVADHSNDKLSASTLSAISAAKQIGGNIDVLVAGSGVDGVAKEVSAVEGVSRVLVKDDVALGRFLCEPLSLFVAELQKASSFSHVLAPASSVGKSFLPRLAALLDVAPVSEIIAVKSPDTFVRPIYAGNALATVQSEDAVKLLTVRSTAFDKAPVGSGAASIEAVAEPVPEWSSSEWLSEELGQSERPELTSASVVVSGGRGMKNGENFQMLYDLADLFGGAVGASRAAVDDGMVPNDMQVGQTGKVVAPELYIAVGISGAIQHLAGMKDSKTIVAINKNEDAPIFQVADYGVVGDLFTIVPELQEKVKALKA
mmetsp:Transcript_4219/g.14879  ORF Transcript_4219/g.14879 Transcript_4219/m.14879 type:complete len:345 (+) Transcript_4219:84-1118(+)